MAVPTVYRWDDAEAPVLCGVKGSMADVLKACLIDGYTGKAAAGWQMEFQNLDKTKTAFRNNPTTCTGFFLLVDESLNGNTAYMTGCELMSDIDTATGLYKTTPYTIYKSSTSNTIPRPWMVIATEKFFYLVTWYGVTGDESVILPPNTKNYIFMFGDFKSSNVENFNSVMSVGWASANIVYGNLLAEPLKAGVSAYTDYTRCPRNITGEFGTATKLWNGACGGPQAAATVWSSMRKTYGTPYVPGRFAISKPYLGDAGTYDMRGSIPGLYFPCHDAESLETLQKVEEDGRTFLLVRSGSQHSVYVTNLFIVIEIGADWDD